MNNDPVINGNILTVFSSDIANISGFALHNNIKSFNVLHTGDSFQMSFPITKDVEDAIPGILHGARARLRALEQDETPEPPPRRA